LASIQAPETYFETSATVISFVLIGKYLELKMEVRTGEAVEKLMELQAKKARVIRNGVETEAPIEEVKVKDVVIVGASDKIPIDGVIIDGQGYVNESMLTGEPTPVLKKPATR